MVINGLTDAQIRAQIARLENILIRREIVLTRKMRTEIRRLWRKYDDLDQALEEFNINIAVIIRDEARKTANAVSKLAEAQLEEEGGLPIRETVLAAIAFALTQRALTSAAQIRGTEEETIRQMARRLASEDKTPREIAQEIRRHGVGYSVHRARLIAEMETRAVADEVTRESIRQSGVTIESKTWISAGDNRVRESHRDVNGETVAFDETFDVGGHRMSEPRDTTNGAPLDEVINCRCTLNYKTA